MSQIMRCAYGSCEQTREVSDVTTRWWCASHGQYASGDAARSELDYQRERADHFHRRLIDLEQRVDWANRLRDKLATAESARDARQRRVYGWAEEAFGADQMIVRQRALRVLEKAIELYQAAGGDLAQGQELLGFVFGREPGKLDNELGGVGVTLLATRAADNGDSVVPGDDRIVRRRAREEARGVLRLVPLREVIDRLPQHAPHLGALAGLCGQPRGLRERVPNGTRDAEDCFADHLAANAASTMTHVARSTVRTKEQP